jgi:hypothetical protein
LYSFYVFSQIWNRVYVLFCSGLCRRIMGVRKN